MEVENATSARASVTLGYSGLPETPNVRPPVHVLVICVSTCRIYIGFCDPTFTYNLIDLQIDICPVAK